MGSDYQDACEALIQRSGDYILLLDDTYRILAASHSFAATFAPGEELLGRDFLELLDPGSRSQARSFLDGLLEGSCTLELNQRSLSGACRLVNYSFCRILTPAGAFSIVTTGRDQEIPLHLVGRMAQLNLELEEARREAEAANQAKDRFLAMLGHELRTPLTPVLLAVTALLDEAAARVLRPDLEMIRRNIELEARLIDDLLDVARIERKELRLTLEVVDVHRAIRWAAELCHAEVLAAGLDVVLEFSARAHHARVDRTRIMQVVCNLIRNAVKHTPAGGRLTIRSRNQGDWRAGGLLIVEFHDTGIGLEPEVVPRIFEPFERGPAPLRVGSSGLGLSLAISRAVAEAHGGRLTAESPGRDQGATFRLELPTVLAPAAPSRGARLSCSAAGEPRGLRILVVEDNKDTLRYLSLVLRKRGYQVLAAESLTAARAAADAAEFDLLISDIELPDGTGLELMRELGGGRGVAGIAMSGFGSQEDIRLSLAAGFATHLTKPLDVGLLEEAIHRFARARELVQATSHLT